MTTDPAALLAAVERLRAGAGEVALPLDLDGVQEARTARREMEQQLDDYVLPRLRSLDAPLLAVVGGSTGAGKSTLVNTVVGQEVSRAGVLRPTTRASVLVHHPDDARWFTGTRVLPGLARVGGEAAEVEDPGAVRLVAAEALPAGLALLDAPDIDSVVAANRQLSKQLLSAADLWLFVTTASRYADAVPWGLLREASERGTSVAIVLNRVPPEAMEQVRVHLATMLREQGLGKSPIFTVPEVDLEDGRIPGRHSERLRGWLHSLASDARARAVVIRRTLSGTLGSLDARAHALADAGRDQVEALGALQEAPEQAYRDALESVGEGVRDGSLLRGEVLARWHELVGTGEFFRSIEAGVGRVRDRLTSFFTGKELTSEPLGEALQTGAAALITSHGQVAASTAARAWKQAPGGRRLVEEHPGLGKASPDFTEQVERLIRDWQRDILEMVREEAGSRRTTARYLAFGVNGLGVLLMVVVFSATAFIPTGAEVAVGAGSAVLAQRLLEAVFGDEAVRRMAARARDDLVDKVRALYAAEAGRFDGVLQRSVPVSPEPIRELEAAAAQVEETR
ncbi:Putative ABC iron siderophore transporter [Serinicoccus hydrothermalis]|uniref:ABC iron siderophore transporter n=1 Tax=Serinicoccus hydrothermalis TaxID=1758689 RepID=A0A1B1NAU1_9MICO|nr:dynamin family protein [Serinicoccus hydrothermalis]ANS78549.1 Putative ABC iron siderophore transporter [Serinicoccus hydrothermalis]